MIKYESMSDNQKKDLIQKLYEQDKKSFKDIADIVGTYANKVRRDAIKFKINIRDKSLAQKNALDSGKVQHPTKGKQRDESTKAKIGKSVMECWEEMTEEELNQRKQKAKNNWDSMSDDDKQNMLQKANIAVRKSSKEGSKLEKFILHNLIQDGYKVSFHVEQTLANTKLQIDMVIPSINVAIEIDGPSHFLPVWGDNALQRNQKYDKKKEGLMIGKGLTLIRIQQNKDFSKARAVLAYEKLKNILLDIENKIVTDKIFHIQD
jgi:very-short-patch-repair endonuclease